MAIPVPAPDGRRATVWLATGTFALLLAILAMPWRTGGWLGTSFVTVWAGVLAALFWVALARGSVLLALVPVLFGLAYAPLLGESVSEGVARVGMRVSPENALYGAALGAVFLAVVVVGGVWVEARLARRARPDAAQDERFDDRAAYAMILVVFGLTLVAALRTGFWTYYGAGRLETAGGVRLELHYPQLLFVLVALVLTRQLDARGMAILAVLAILVFALQQRRTMMACAGLLVITATVTGSGLRKRALYAAAAVALVVAFFASDSWRARRTARPVEAIAGAVERFGAAPSVDTRALEQRFAYAWIDGLAVQYGERLRALDLAQAALGDMAMATPALVFPEKYTVRAESCETSFRRLGLTVDLPCTAVTEGYLALGPAGVFLVAGLWAGFLGFASHLSRSPRALRRIFGLCCFVPIIDVETNAFPMLHGLRLALIMLLVVGGVARISAALAKARADGLHGRPDAPPSMRPIR
jgi:hypothetical protein